MRTVMPTGDGDEMAGMGIFAKVVVGDTCWWHNGFWGSATLFCPHHRLAVSVTTNAFTADRSVPGAVTDAVVLATTALGLLEHRQR
jgi:D-alanyl-D-alanine carboxypeptidase